MVELTEQQYLLLESPEPLILDPRTQQVYVLVPKEVYERIQGLLYDGSDWTPQEQLQLLAESGKRAGWDAPEMDVYDNYDERRNNLNRPP